MPTRHKLLLEFHLISKESYDALGDNTKYFLKASEAAIGHSMDLHTAPSVVLKERTSGTVTVSYA